MTGGPRLQDGALAAAIRPADEVHVLAEVHRHVAVAHEILHVDFLDLARAAVARAGVRAERLNLQAVPTGV